MNVNAYPRIGQESSGRPHAAEQSMGRETSTARSCQENGVRKVPGYIESAAGGEGKPCIMYKYFTGLTIFVQERDKQAIKDLNQHWEEKQREQAAEFEKRLVQTVWNHFGCPSVDRY